MKIAIDIGTSLTKAVLYNDSIQAVTVRSRPTQMLHPAPGRYEHDVSAITDAVLDLLTELPGDGVDLVVVTGQGDGLWLLDVDGRAVCPAVSWMDNRGGPDYERWFESGTAEAIFRRTGNMPFAGAGSVLLTAMERTQSDLMDRAATATQCQHAIIQALTGERFATRSAAMLGVFDPVAGGYDQEALRQTGLDRHAGLLPEFSSAPVASAPIKQYLAEHIGLHPQTLVASGPYDLPAAAWGAGVTEPGDGLLILGTTLACLVRRDAVELDGEPSGMTLRTADDRGYLRAMPAMVGTAGLDWLLSLLGTSHGELDGALAASEPGARGVSALPYLSPAGERAPFVDPRARGQFTGLSLSTTPADMVRAYCEALAYAARHCFDAAGLTGMVSVCGGGASSQHLVSLFADALGRPVAVVDEPEITARGAVTSACLDRAGTTRCGIRPIEPSANRAVYQDGYARYLARVALAVSGGATGKAPRSLDLLTRPVT